MASLRKDIPIEASAEFVWAALRDFGALHKRLVRGFVVDAYMESEASRVVTFFNGVTARELLVTCDDEARRLVYSLVGGRASHYNAAAQVFAEGEKRSRLVWLIDLLPDELAPGIATMMTRGAAAMQETLRQPP